MVWAAINFNGSRIIKLIEGRLNSKKYLKVVKECIKDNEEFDEDAPIDLETLKNFVEEIKEFKYSIDDSVEIIKTAKEFPDKFVKMKDYIWELKESPFKNFNT